MPRVGAVHCIKTIASFGNWGTLKDTDDEDTWKELCVQGGLSMTPEQFVKRVNDQDVKDRIRGST